MDRESESTAMAMGTQVKHCYRQFIGFCRSKGFHRETAPSTCPAGSHCETYRALLFSHHWDTTVVFCFYPLLTTKKSEFCAYNESLPWTHPPDEHTIQHPHIVFHSSIGSGSSFFKARLVNLNFISLFMCSW